MGGQLETVGERGGGLPLGEMVFERQRLVGGFDGFDGVAGSSGSSGFDGLVASIAPVMMMVLRASLTLEAQRNTNVKDLLLLRLWASTKIGKFLKRDAPEPTTPRVTDGSRSPRRADKFDGERVEGLSWIKLMVNELKDSPISEDTADAERQTKDARRGTIMKLLSGND